MSDKSQAAVAEPEQVERVRPARQRKRAQARTKPRRQPPYNVILWDDPNHTHEYVIGMVQQLFGYSWTRGWELADQVHTTGKAIVLTTTLEHAELKRDQIRAFGKDISDANGHGSMYATIEPAP